MSDSHTDIRQQLLDLVGHLEHVLPGQAPIKDFVHHNTLHGFQHLPFPQALKAAREVTDNYGYETEEKFRGYYKHGRINADDLNHVISESKTLQAEVGIGESLSRRDIYRCALLHPLKPVDGGQLFWYIEEQDALHRFQHDVSDSSRNKLLTAAAAHGQTTEADAIHGLWNSCLSSLGLSHYLLHPEDLVDLDPERAAALLRPVNKDEQETAGPALHHEQVQKEARNLLGRLLRTVGHDNTLRGFLLALTGDDILEDLRPMLQRQVANFLDQGMSAWHHVDRDKGFYHAWRTSAQADMAGLFEELPDWHDSINGLPDNAMDAIIAELTVMGIPESHWTHYLQRLALEIPGWSGIFLWRHLKPGYEDSHHRVDMLDYLAVRLVLEHMYAKRLCRRYWQIEANLDVLRWYFRRRRSEFFVRYVLFNEHLPEYLVYLAQRQIEYARISPQDYTPWKHLSDMVMIWRQSPMSDHHQGYTVFRNAWQLFRIAQHLGLCSEDIEALSKNQIATIFDCLEILDEEQRGFLWLQAYEHHYHEQLFNAVVNNQGRGRWQQADQRPQAQITFCMDDREEGIRRHLEEHNPNIETLGAAGFFGVAINWRGLDDDKVTPLCPVVVDPAHELQERVDPEQQALMQPHRTRRRFRIKIQDIIQQDTRRSLLTPLLVTLSAPLALITLLGKVFSYRLLAQLLNKARDSFDIPLNTHVAINAESCDHEPSPEHNQLGFTDIEQADRIQNFLRTVGLNKQLAPLVIMMGHGSSSVNNPHMAAYDCGACSGRHGGPNARIFAAIANRPEIRAILKQRGMDIPDDTWFLGAEHNTCDETITWYDSEAIPEQMHPAFAAIKADILHATRMSAHERCRRLASAPTRPSLNKALKHIMGRAHDFSQARPELGHATNAAAIIGRRSISQGTFFDRRVFLISYDPTQDDEEGHIIEAILLAAGPVGAGINLEYYFSTVNNDEYGSGSKITHNVTGLFAVMDGTNSDLRTGLPRQMIEIHEAMRLQVMVEARVDVLTKIYQRQPALQELVGNGWLLLSAKDPDSEQIHIFKPDQGFVPWTGPVSDLPMVDNSPQWYDGHHLPLSPALIKQDAVSQETPHA